MNKNITEEGIIRELTGLEGSTTVYLEGLRGDRLRVLVDSQECFQTTTGTVIRRISRLFFVSPDTPLLYCISEFNKNELLQEECCLLSQEDIPVGKAFMLVNDPLSITKADINVRAVSDPQIAGHLNVLSPRLFRKEYRYVVGGRSVGRIVEFFNEESLMRI